jgi:uncharacterized damage-inducible protein DinB
MHKYYEALLDRFDELHRAVDETLAELPPEALDWVPGPDMNSVSVLIVHMTGAEHYWVGDVIHGDLSFRDRNAEFRTKGMDAAALRLCLTDLAAYERSTFETMGLDDLEQERIAPRDGRAFTVAWALNHALEHTAVHVGHIQILKQQWLQREGAGPKARARKS